jgi:hypothetical protein
MNTSSTPGAPMTRRKRAVFTILAITLAWIVALLLAEILLRLAFPQETMSPRWDFSAQYCAIPFPSEHMVHERAGRWRFVYTTNSYRGRGKEISVSNRYERPNIVVLGDSYSFGAGVDDGDEYAAVLDRALSGNADVINLGVGGWGLTQEIRRYYEFGILYQPHVVILQFSGNDPEDNLTCPVTTVHDGRFQFGDTRDAIFWVKTYLSRSAIQKSQVYNLLRDSIYRFFRARTVARSRHSVEAPGNSPPASVDQRVYIELISAFADDLHRSGVRLIFLTVNRQLQEFPAIDHAIHELADDRKLEFFDAASWLDGMVNFASPEGHLWGKPAHRVIGTRLAQIVQDGARLPGK